MIYIQVLDRYWNAGDKLAKKVGWKEPELIKFQRYLAEQYKELIVKAIDDQRFRNKWPALSFMHLNYKKSHGYPSNMWEMTGELKKSLKVTRKRSKVIEIGFPNKKHSGAGMKLVELAQVLEFGDIRIPPRPLFRLVYRYMSSNIDFFYRKYEKGSDKK